MHALPLDEAIVDALGVHHDVEVDGSDSVNSDDSLSESSDSVDTEVPVLPKRMRKASVMVGSVKKGKYSA